MKMQMADYEIKQNVLEAKDQKQQITICAELNAVKPEVIKDILRKQGVKLTTLKGSADSRKKSDDLTSRIERQEITVQEAAGRIRKELKDIERQQYRLDIRRAELYELLKELSEFV